MVVSSVVEDNNRGGQMKVLININKVIQVTSNDGGYLGGRCLVCDSAGYLREGYSYPFNSIGYRGHGLLGNELVHKKNCTMNRYLHSDGRRKY